MGFEQLAQIVAAHKAAAAAADDERPIIDVVRRIANRYHNLARFWSKPQGWAGPAAAAMLSKARLDRLTKLAKSLQRWVLPTADLDEGDLILAWANLGALVDGLLKLHLSVYFTDYVADVATGKASQAWHHKKELMLDPDGLHLETLILFHEKADLLNKKQLEFVRLVQARRNIIHAFKDAHLGTPQEFIVALRDYRRLLKDIALRLPYPDDMYAPTEQGPY